MIVLFWTQSEVIRDLADKESCVIIGRCADFVLREHENVLKIFIQAPLADRVARISEKYLIEIPSEAKKKCCAMISFAGAIISFIPITSGAAGTIKTWLSTVVFSVLTVL